MAVDGELTKAQASHEPTQSFKPDAVGREAFAAILTIPTFRSRGVVTRTVHTRQFRTIKRTSRKTNFGSVLFHEDETTNKTVEVVEDTILGGSPKRGGPACLVIDRDKYKSLRYDVGISARTKKKKNPQKNRTCSRRELDGMLFLVYNSRERSWIDKKKQLAAQDISF